MAKGKKKGALSFKEKKEVAKIAKSVQRKQAETKLIVTTAAAQALAANVALITDHTSILQGTTQNTRVGLSITPHNIRVKSTFSSANNTNIRSIIFQWHPDSAASFPVVGSILDIGANGVTPDTLSQHNWFNRSQYTILSDVTKVSTTQGNQEIFINQMPKKKLRQISYNSGAVSTGENHIFSCLISETGSTNSQVCQTMFMDS